MTKRNFNFIYTVSVENDVVFFSKDAVCNATPNKLISAQIIWHSSFLSDWKLEQPTRKAPKPSLTKTAFHVSSGSATIAYLFLTRHCARICIFVHQKHIKPVKVLGRSFFFCFVPAAPNLSNTFFCFDTFIQIFAVRKIAEILCWNFFVERVV